MTKTKYLWLLFAFFLFSIFLPVRAVEEYQPDQFYTAGDQVVMDGNLYECMDGMYAIYCQYAWGAPTSQYGHYMWVDLGPYVEDPNAKKITCTLEGDFDELPKFQMNTHNPGDKIQYNGTIYECTDPYGVTPSYCHYSAYAPGSHYSHYFWTPLGEYNPPLVCRNEKGHLCTEDDSEALEYPSFTAGIHGPGNKIAYGDSIYECIDPYGYTPSFCTYEAYAPGTYYAHYFWRQVGRIERKLICKPDVYEQNFSQLTIGDLSNNSLFYSDGTTGLVDDLGGDLESKAIDIRSEDALFDTGITVPQTQTTFAFEVKVKPNMKSTGNQVPRIVGIGEFFHLRLDNRLGNGTAKVLLTYKAKNAMGRTMTYSFVTNTLVTNGEVSKLKVSFSDQAENLPSWAKAQVCLYKDEVLASCHNIGGTLDYLTLSQGNIVLAPKGPGIQTTNWKYFGTLDDFRFGEVLD